MKSENPRMNKIFSKKKTKHEMDLRKYQTIEVTSAKQIKTIINTIYAKNPQFRKSRISKTKLKKKDEIS